MSPLPPLSPQPHKAVPTTGVRAAWATLTRGWKIGAVAVAAVLLFVFAAAIAALAAAGQETRTVTDEITIAQAAPPPHTVTETRTVTATHTVGGTASSGSSPVRGNSDRTYSGNGSKNLGDITVGADSTLRWTNDGGIFQIFDDDFGLTVNSDASSGETAAPAGTYTNVFVNAIGNWTIEIVPG